MNGWNGGLDEQMQWMHHSDAQLNGFHEQEDVINIYELDKLPVIDKTNNMRTQSVCKKYSIVAPTRFGGWLISSANSAYNICDTKRKKDTLDPTCM